MDSSDKFVAGIFLVAMLTILTTGWYFYSYNMHDRDLTHEETMALHSKK
jgi:hypothetical protein